MNSIFGFFYAVHSALALYCQVRGVPVSEFSHITNAGNYGLIAYLLLKDFDDDK